MKILIVGGAGYIGGYMTDLFLKNPEFEVSVYDNLLFEKMFLKKTNFIFGDVRDTKKLGKIINEFDIVIWLAAIVGDAACAVNEELTNHVNLESVKWLVDHYQGKIIFMSTCAVYGMNNNPNPLSEYARTKLEAENYIKKNKSDYLIFRLGTLYGIGDNTSRLRFDLVINILTLKAVYGEPLTVFGGQQWRPILHVKDVAHAVQFSIQNDIAGCYNLSERNVVIADLAKMIAKIVPNTQITYSEMKFEDLRDYKVKNDLILSRGWKPIFSLQDGIYELVEVIRNHRVIDGYDPLYSNHRYIMLLGQKNDELQLEEVN